MADIAQLQEVVKNTCLSFLSLFKSNISFFSKFLTRFEIEREVSYIAQSVHIHCRHIILAHLFFRDFSLPSLFLYSLSLSLFSSLPLSLTHSLPHLSLSPILSSSLSLSLPLLSLFLSLHFFPPFSFFLFKTFQPL